MVCLTACVSSADSAEQDQTLYFREKIEPVLKSQCYGCHSNQADKVQGGLRLDSRAGLRRGGESGPSVAPGKIGESLLIQAIRHDGGLAMPPKQPKLSDSTIADFVKWVETGAFDPRDGADSDDASSGLKDGLQHWAFQSVKKVDPPSVKDDAWSRSTIDAFVLAKLEERQWQPSPPATRAELIRRLSFDLVGLPPAPEEIEAFVNDPLPDAWPRHVDRLLDSRQYGERAAIHWLDVVRFAETEGYEYDRHIPDAWRYRDFVIDSLSADKPFDQFVREQIAGDEIDPQNPECQTASIFHRLGPIRRNAGNPDIALSRNEVLTERTDIIGAAILGMTVACARCHNHKLEPISQKDYYRLQAYLAATEEHNIVMASADEQRDWEARTRQVKDEIAALRAKARKTEGSEKRQLEEQIEALEDQLPGPLATIPATWNAMQTRTAIHVLRRGVWESKGEPVGPRPPGVLVTDGLSELPADVKNPRTQLAQWLTSRDNPLTARVIVNRLWQQHFGVGLVKTANDFGVKGERPSHPELLDWLAATLVEGGWRLKPIHRLIVLSNTYQQSSDVRDPSATRKQPAHSEPWPDARDPAATRKQPAYSEPLPDARDPAATRKQPAYSEPMPDARENPLTPALSPQGRGEGDPENRLLWHFPRRRLSAEEVRDAMLLVSGRINFKMGGPSVIVPVDLELVQLLYKPSQWLVTKDATEHDRRSIYLMSKRNLRLPFLENLDAPALQTSCARRESSTHAPQALELLNGSLSNDLAQAFARRLEQEAQGDADRIVDRAFRLALGRAPFPNERTQSLEFLREQPLHEFTLALFNLNGFLYVQ